MRNIQNFIAIPACLLFLSSTLVAQDGEKKSEKIAHWAHVIAVPITSDVAAIQSISFVADTFERFEDGREEPGFVFVREAEELFEQARARIREIATNEDVSNLSARIEKDLAKFFYAETKRRPMVFVFTSEITYT